MYTHRLSGSIITHTHVRHLAPAARSRFLYYTLQHNAYARLILSRKLRGKNLSLSPCYIPQGHGKRHSFALSLSRENRRERRRGGGAAAAAAAADALDIHAQGDNISTHTHTYIYALYMIAKKTTQPVDSDNISSCICVYIYTTYGSVFCVGESVTTLQPVYIYVCIYV